MTGKHVENSICLVCGGRMSKGLTTVPFVLDKSVIVVKDVRAEICSSGGESYMSGGVSDDIALLLEQSQHLHADVLVLTYEKSNSLKSVAA